MKTDTQTRLDYLKNSDETQGTTGKVRQEKGGSEMSKKR